jgi:hypothetical protein
MTLLTTTITTESGQTITIRNKIRRTPTTEALYMRVIRTAYPAMQDVERKTIAVVDDALKISDEAERNTWRNTHFIALTTAYEVENNIFNDAKPFSAIAARIMAVTGFQFQIGTDGRFSDADFLLAFDDYLDSDGSESDVWVQVKAAIDAMDAPLTPPEIAPPKTLTEAQRADPLSVVDGVNSRLNTKNASSLS